jgi:ubiquinone/menaquinone biosynthesis C-methylase UbiE
MEDWYRDFVGADRAEAEAVFLGEYQPYARLLGSFGGRIVDVGGGAGLAGRFLPTDSDYVVVDPSPLWEEPEWRDISARFTEAGAVPTFIHGTGEALPFGDAEFDGLLAFWSFNHAADPFACLDEAYRVVKPGGRLLIVLEDMIPSWGDVARLWIEEKEQRYLKRWRRWPIEWHQPGIEGARATVSYKLSGRAWPLQNDHVRIEEPAFRAAIEGRFRIVDRNWDGGFLSYELKRLP